MHILPMHSFNKYLLLVSDLSLSGTVLGSDDRGVGVEGRRLCHEGD